MQTPQKKFVQIQIVYLEREGTTFKRKSNSVDGNL